MALGCPHNYLKGQHPQMINQIFNPQINQKISPYVYLKDDRWLLQILAIAKYK